jgi:hypothetical protein
MRALFDFKCEQGHVNESFVDTTLTTISCPVCSLQAKRIISPVRSSLDPISGDFMGATAKWEKMRAQKIQQERKANS